MWYLDFLFIYFLCFLLIKVSLRRAVVHVVAGFPSQNHVSCFRTLRHPGERHQYVFDAPQVFCISRSNQLYDFFFSYYLDVIYFSSWYFQLTIFISSNSKKKPERIYMYVMCCVRLRQYAEHLMLTSSPQNQAIRTFCLKDTYKINIRMVCFYSIFFLRCCL